MFRNYLTTYLRSLRKHSTFSIINIAGITIGIAASLVIFTIVHYELSYDAFQHNYKNIYHVVTQDKYPDGFTYNPGVNVAALDGLRAKFPNIPFACINSTAGSQLSVNNSSNSSANKKFIEPAGVFFCEPSFFKLFGYNWLAGNAGVLNQPNTIVLSKKMAEKYFGNWQQAINKTITLDNAIPLKVAGILQDFPANTDFPLNFLISFETLKSNADKYNYHNDWNNLSSNFQVFALLPPSIKATTINAQLAAFSKEHYTDRASHRTNLLQPLSEVHFDNRYGNFGDHTTSKSTLLTLSLIGVFILIMACINFINLATAQAVARSKEIGIRKVLGSNRLQLFIQVMGETALLVTTSMLLAIVVAYLCLPYIKHIASIQESLALFTPQTLGFLLLVLIAVTVLSGLYPSMILSGYNASLALKNKISSAGIGGISLRRALVVMQFAISQILIIGMIVAISQMNFINHADLGFNKDALLLLTANTDSAVVAEMPAFKQKLLQTPGIQSVSFNADAPSSDNTWSSNFAFDHKADENYPVSLKFADDDYFKTFGLQLAAGRVYGKSDTMNEIVINETLLHKLGLQNAQQAIDKDIRLGSGSWKRIVGVVKDFKTHSLKLGINPILMAENSEYYGITAIKIRSSDLMQTQATVQNIWNEFFPAYAYTSSFMDESVARFYEQESHLELLYKIFAGLAIFISCLGLYGLVSFMAVRKTKEIGVRKVLGANTANIIYLFSKEFTILITVAFLAAAPLAYLIMHAWLNNFTYRINIGISVFALAIVLSLFIAWLTVGYKAIKAALANPVKSLRTE